MSHRQKMSRVRKLSLLGSQFVYMGVLSNDFATVYFREELSKTTPPKKQIQRATSIGQSFRRNRGQKIIRTSTCRLGSYCSCMVRMTGLEPAQPCDHKILNLARLPIPPHPHGTRIILLYIRTVVKDFPDIFSAFISVAFVSAFYAAAI